MVPFILIWVSKMPAFMMGLNNTIGRYIVVFPVLYFAE